jgi:peptide/nickel transport system substrate-binding protein
MLPTGSTVLPQLFDSRVNLSKAGTGRDHGSFHDARVNAEITRIGTIADPQAGARAWAALDASLAERGAFIALAQRRAVYIGGSAVTGLAANEALGGVVDLAGTGVG